MVFLDIIYENNIFYIINMWVKILFLSKPVVDNSNLIIII